MASDGCLNECKCSASYFQKTNSEWLKETKNDDDFEAFSIEKLDSHLRDFYAEVRNTNGQMYSRSTSFRIAGD
jgi:hypothetical protein